MTALRAQRYRRAPALRAPRLARPRLSPEAWWIWAAVVLFIAVSAWWLSQDTRVPDWDSGAHEFYAYTINGELAHGQLTKPFTDFNTYPPLVHFVGAIAMFIAGLHPMAMILSSNLVFVPLLAFGCFGVGRIAYGPRAGLLAGIVALATPMFASMMHEYDLDPPQAAMVAVTVWAVLASRRFERLGLSALAGALAGLALMTKETSVVFLGAFLLPVVLRGGWRNWLGLLVFAFVAENVAGPWYVYHWHQLGQAFSNLGGQAGLAPGSFQTPPRLSVRSLTWYGWNFVNLQVMAPFALAFAIGSLSVLWRLIRGRLPAGSFEPDLLVGAVLSYLGMTLLVHKDPRYTLPMLVYVAVLATGWITLLPRPRWRQGLSWAVIVLAAVYFFGVSLGIGGPVRIKLPNAQQNLIYQRQLALYDPTGYVRGGPVHAGNVPALLDGLRRMGISNILVNTGPDPVDFNTWGLTVLVEAHHLNYGATTIPAAQTAYLILTAPGASTIPPCQVIDGWKIYAIHGTAPGLDPSTLRDPQQPSRRYQFLCPGSPARLDQ